MQDESLPFRPRDRLDRRLEAGRLSPRHVRAIAKELARQHAAGLPAAETQGPGPAALAQRLRLAAGTVHDLGAISETERSVLAAQARDLGGTDLDRILARAQEGRVRAQLVAPEPSAVFVRRRHATISASEHAESGGSGDVVLDLARLTSALRPSLPDLAEQMLAAYALASDDYALYELVDFHECLHACERAAAHEAREARTALLPWIATSHRHGAWRTSLILLTGQVASGKSTVAKALVERLGAPRVVADRVRQAILDPVAEIAGPDAALERAWSEAFDERVYSGVIRRAGFVLRSGRSALIDACSPTRQARSHVATLARDCGVEFVIGTCRSSEARSRERLAARDLRDGVAPGSWAKIARDLDEQFEPVGSDEDGHHVLVRTGEDLESSVADVIAAVPAASPPRPIWAIRSELPGAVTFDCWNTLLEERDWPEAHRLRVAALHAATIEDGAECDLEVVGKAFDRAWLRHMDLWRKGVASGAREVARWSMEALDIPLAEPVIAHLTERFQEASHSSDVAALDGAFETLSRLHEAGIPMALICDTGLTPGRVVRRHLDRVGLLAPLRAQLFSDEVGVPKPDARIFQAALDALGAEPATCVHVGDLRHTDVAGARGLGMRSVRISASHDDDSAFAEADAVADSHEALRDLLGVA